jgi:hypothetical protein
VFGFVEAEMGFELTWRFCWVLQGEFGGFMGDEGDDGRIYGRRRRWWVD